MATDCILWEKARNKHVARLYAIHQSHVSKIVGNTRRLTLEG